ncbi:hypothetical protein R83H12_01560 [Fibrobacteria bacterium R8-3-H12]
MANPLSIFFSRLAPEDKRFIRKIGFFLVFMLLASGGALYLYSRYGMDLIERITGSKQTPKQNAFELPPPPVIPEVAEEKSEDSVETSETAKPADTAETAKATDVDEPDMDLQSEEPTGEVSIQGISRMFLENPKLAARLGHLLLEAGYPSEAVYILQNGISLGSAPISVLVDLAYGYFYSKRFETALSKLDTAFSKYSCDFLKSPFCII